MVHVIDVLDQLIAAVCDGAGGIDEGQQFSFRRADLTLYPQADARALVVAEIVGAVVVGKVLVLAISS